MFNAPTQPQATRGLSPAWQITLVAALIGVLSLAMVFSAAALSCLS
jgi:hypothetical protein